MVCDHALNKSRLCLEQDGVPSAAARNIVEHRGTRRLAAAAARSRTDVAGVIKGRQETYDSTELCPDCGSIKKRLSACPRCEGSGHVPSEALPDTLRSKVGTDRVTADDLARMVSRGDGALNVVRAFPGVVSRLDDEGRRQLIEAAHRRPMMAMLGRTPDALVEVGGKDVLKEIARKKPRLARRSLRTSAILELE